MSWCYSLPKYKIPIIHNTGDYTTNKWVFAVHIPYNINQSLIFIYLLYYSPCFSSSFPCIVLPFNSYRSFHTFFNSAVLVNSTICLHAVSLVKNSHFLFNNLSISGSLYNFNQYIMDTSHLLPHHLTLSNFKSIIKITLGYCYSCYNMVKPVAIVSMEIIFLSKISVCVIFPQLSFISSGPKEMPT